MKLRTRPQGPAAANGFSLIEVLVVVGLIAVMAAVALPNIVGYVRYAKVRAATQQLSSEIQTARNRAISKNVSPGLRGGVAFVVLDQNSYRFAVLDDRFLRDPTSPDPTAGLGPVRDLPAGVSFVAAAITPVNGFGFDNLGRRCKLGSTQPPCAVTQSTTQMCADGDPRCTDRPSGAFVGETGTLNDVNLQIRVREDVTQIERWLRVDGGGRVMVQK